MKMTRNSLGIVLVAIGIIAAERNACAQADLHVTVRRDAASGKSHVSWLVKSLVPSPGNAGFAGYQIWTSTNLTDWIPLGNPLSGLDFENETIDRELPDLTGAPVFARIESLLDFGDLSFVGFSLANARFSKGFFRGSDFFEANLSGADFKGADLGAADFGFATLSNADLENANCMGANFSGATLDAVNAREANLSFSDFSGADLSNADLTGADLRFTSFLGTTFNFLGLQNTTIDENTKLPDKVALVWKLVNQKLAGTTFTNTDLLLCNLEDADLRNCIFKTVDLRGSDLQGTDLSGANLLTANLGLVDFRRSKIDAATKLSPKNRLVWELNNQDSSGRDLGGRDLSSALFVSARLSGANLTNANLRLSTLIQADLSEAKLRNASLIQADLTGANLQNADLTSADFSSADLTQADLRGATGGFSVRFNGTIFNQTIMPDGTVRNPNVLLFKN